MLASTRRAVSIPTDNFSLLPIENLSLGLGADPMRPHWVAGAETTTLYVAIEISRKSWVVGIKSPQGEKIGLRSLDAADVAGLRGVIAQHQSKAERALDQGVTVRVCCEAGYEGFWLARWLEQEMAIETVVLDPASLLVNRKAKQRKTDRMDATKMVRALLAYDRGDAAVLSQVRVPSVAEEDRKRLLRERQRLVKERTSLTNTIKGRLTLRGVFGLEPRSRTFAATLGEVETERDAVLRPRAAPAPEGTSPECPAATIAALVLLRGIGANDATLLAHEVFYREFRNRRELASWAGLTPTPWTSGDVQRDQGIGRDGPAWIRAQLVQMAWRWVRFQPDSALSQWFEARTAGGRRRIRRVMIVALARKLLIALRRFTDTGLVPSGAHVA